MLLTTKTVKHRVPRVQVRADAYAQASGDRRDCAVRAVATALCLPDDVVRQAFVAAGRVPGRGYACRRIVEGRLEAGPRRRLTHAVRGLTLQTFAETHPTGHWIVRVSGHMLAVCDGTIHDWPGMGVYRRIVSAWRVV